MRPGARWEYFDSPKLSSSRITQEIAREKLSKQEVIRLDALLERVANGKGIPDKDFKHLKSEGLWEIRFQANKRIFRLLYSRERDGVLVLVALHFVPKKQSKLPKRSFDTARKRLDTWRRQHQAESDIMNR